MQKKRRNRLGTTQKRGPRMCSVHILECIEKIEYICKVDPYFQHPILHDALLRNLHTMAESTKYVWNDIKEEHSDIPWRGIKHLRNQIVHGYLTVNIDKQIKEFIKTDMPQIKHILQDRYPDWRNIEKRTLQISMTHYKEKG